MTQLEYLHVWHDITPRSGATNMAIDQLLLETIQHMPILRFYEWEKPSVSFGYFESFTTVQQHFNDGELDYIRRCTGGGIVDHRVGITYTLAMPRNHPLTQLKGAESYRVIHEAVAMALKECGTLCKLTTSQKDNDTATCFTNPVTHDIVRPTGEKLAGAGQRRTKYGLLHQGAVIGIRDIQLWRASLIKSLSHQAVVWSPDKTLIQSVDTIAKSRYSNPAWTAKRV